MTVRESERRCFAKDAACVAFGAIIRKLLNRISVCGTAKNSVFPAAAAAGVVLKDFFMGKRAVVVLRRGDFPVQMPAPQKLFPLQGFGWSGML